MTQSAAAPLDRASPVPEGAAPGVSLEAYRALAAFRLELRRGLAFSTHASEAVGLPPVQYQAMLAIKAHDGAISVSDLARELLIEVNSAVELARRLVTAGLVARRRSVADRRSVLLSLTTPGETRLARLAHQHLAEAQVRVPNLIEKLTAIAALAASLPGG